MASASASLSPSSDCRRTSGNLGWTAMAFLSTSMAYLSLHVFGKAFESYFLFSHNGMNSTQGFIILTGGRISQARMMLATSSYVIDVKAWSIDVATSSDELRLYSDETQLVAGADKAVCTLSVVIAAPAATLAFNDYDEMAAPIPGKGDLLASRARMDTLCDGSTRALVSNIKAKYTSSITTEEPAELRALHIRDSNRDSKA